MWTTDQNQNAAPQERPDLDRELSLSIFSPLSVLNLPWKIGKMKLTLIFLLYTICFAQCSVQNARVVIVGAGAAGLTAAGTLVEAGFDPQNIIILEGRDTYGGRIRTDTSLGFPWSLGPMWIDGIGRYSGDSFQGSDDEYDGCGFKGIPYNLPTGKLCQPVEAIATKYNIDYKVQPDNSVYWDYDGTFLGYDRACQNQESPLTYPCTDTPGPYNIPTQIVQDWGGGSGYSSDLNRTCMLGWLVWNAPTNAKSDDSVQSGVNQCDLKFQQIGTDTVNHTRYRNWQLQSAITCDYACDASADSWHNFEEDGWFNDRDATLTDGYQGVADALYNRVKDAGVNITYNAKVTAIDSSTPTVTYNSGAVMKADYIISTVSFTQYKNNKIRFTPVLPSTFQTAMNHLQQGHLEKVMLTFNSSFWREYDPKIRAHTGWLMFMSDTIGEYPEFNLMDEWNGQNAMLTWVGGEYAREQASKSDEEVRTRLQEIINSMWPTAGDASTILQMVRSNWTNDEWTMGSYSYWGVHYDMYYDWKALLGPIGQVHFAGEHTRRDHPSSMEGAIWSGEDAANEVCRAVGGCKSFVFHPDTLVDAHAQR
mgnify:CR=1 FL=1